MRARRIAGLAVLVAAGGAAGLLAWFHYRGDPCGDTRRELDSPYWPEAGATRAFCRHELDAARRMAAAAHQSPDRWYLEIAAQRFMLAGQIVKRLAATDPTQPLPVFERYPDKPPCAEGLTFSPEQWQATPLGRIGVKRPERLHFSFAVNQVAGDGGGATRLVVREWQDLNCDGVLGLTQYEGYLTRTHTFTFDKDWKLLRATYCPSLTE